MIAGGVLTCNHHCQCRCDHADSQLVSFHILTTSADIFLSISEAFFDFSLSSCFSTVSSISHPARSIHKNWIFPFRYPQFFPCASFFCGKHNSFLRIPCKTSPMLSTPYFLDLLHVKKRAGTGNFLPFPALAFTCIYCNLPYTVLASAMLSTADPESVIASAVTSMYSSPPYSAKLTRH